jgi:N-acetylmuramoyl-L-alanine amidase
MRYLFATVTLAGLWFANVDAEPPLPGAVPFEIQVIPAPPAEPWRLMAIEHEGVIYLASNQLAAALHLDTFWRADLGRLILSSKSHRITVTEGTDLAVIDDGRLLHLSGPIFLSQGQMMLPLDLFIDVSGEPLPWVEESLVFSKADRVLRIGTPKTSVVGGRTTVSDTGWKLQVDGSGAFKTEVRQEAGPELVVRFPGTSYDPERVSLPKVSSRWLSWVVGYRAEATAQGFEVHLLPALASRGYQVTSADSSRVEILLGTLESLQPFSGIPLMSLHRIAIDPGHGGSDTGVTVKGGKEAKLDWALAGYVQEQLQNAGMEVVLTRTDGDDPGPDARSNAANRANADLLLSLHVHGRPGGAIAYLNTGGGQSLGASSLDDLGFHHYGTDHGSHESDSRSIAAAILQSVIAGGLGATPCPGIETESVPELAGARMPAVLLEMGTDPKNGWSDARLRSLAETIAAGILHAAGKRANPEFMH